MKHVVLIGSDAMTYIPSFEQTGSSIKKFGEGCTQTQHGAA
jgi:hypothetical protein